MSTRAQTHVHAGRGVSQSIDGATARVLSSGPAEHAAERRRTPLALVPAAATARGRKAGFAVFCFAVMLAALVSVLVINIAVAGGQYKIVGLQNQERSLDQENEALTQQLQNLEAPQNVAAKAAELGMVVPASVASIDLGTLQISGTATPAVKEELPTALVAAPEKPQTAQAPAEAPAEDAGPAAAEAAPAQEQAPANDAGAEPAGAEEAAAGEQAGQDADSGTESTTQELNGGTIPAPAQKGSDR